MSTPRQIIVIIDDNVDLARSYQEILLGEGYDAHVAASGSDALALLEKLQAPHLILLDCLMPGMSGEDFLKEFARRLPHLACQTPVVGFSSFFSDSPHLEGLRDRVRCIVEKPHDIEDFVHMVKSQARAS